LHTIQLVGQVITSTNYTTQRLFDFSPELVQNAAETFLLCGVAEAFAILRRKARPTAGVVRGALEIDVPRQHPRLEVRCAALYLASAHGVRTTMGLSNDDLIRRVFPPQSA